MKAWKTLTGEDIVLHGSGRTDAGVHALGQCAHFDTLCTIPLSSIPLAWNTRLPSDVRILWAKEVDADFHARFDVKRKTYTYKLYWGETANVFLSDTAYHVVKKPDVNAMRDASKLLVGEHDFKAMQATGGHVVSTVRALYDIEITEVDHTLSITVTGNGFLYNMVRILAGTLLYVGWGWLSKEDMMRGIESKNRTMLGKTLPAHGLYLSKVEY